MMSRILLVKCPDQPGLIHAITSILYKQGANITANREFVDQESAMFFMRSEFTNGFEDQLLLKELRESLPNDSTIYLPQNKKKKIILLATKESHVLGDILLRHDSGELNAKIIKVISNHEDLRSLSERFEIPFECISHEGLDRQDHEKKMLDAIIPHAPDYLVLAKYMRVLNPEFVEHFPNQIINIHHSFLPAFIGARPYHQAYERGVKIIGATAHFVNHSLDDGPIIFQNVTPVNHAHSVKNMIQAGRDIEKIVLARALKLALEDRIFTNGNRTIVFD